MVSWDTSAADYTKGEFARGAAEARSPWVDSAREARQWDTSIADETKGDFAQQAAEDRQWDTSIADETKGDFVESAAEARSPWADSAREARQWDTSIADETKGNFAESAAEARSSWGDDGGTGDDAGGGYDFGAGQGGMFNASFDDGGYVDEDIEGQGSDDAMIDPMQYIQGALDWGRRQYGIPTGDGQMSFDDGGVVPTADDQPQQGMVDPRQAMAYLSGDGAVSPEIAQALEQRIDPQGQMNPTQRAMAAIGVAPTDEAKFGLLQHYRTKYNGFAAAAKAAMNRGDMGEAAQQATQAMDAVPNGQRTQFAPAPGGLAMVDRPAFARGGGQRRPQQSFARGGYVQSFEDGEEVYPEEDEEAQGTRSYIQPPPPDDVPVSAPSESAGDDVLMAAQGDAGAQPRQDAEDQTEGALGAYPRSDRAIINEGEARRQFTKPLDAAYRDIPLVDQQEPTLSKQLNRGGEWYGHPLLESAQTPHVVPPQEVAKILDEGFDAQLAKKERNLRIDPYGFIGKTGAENMPRGADPNFVPGMTPRDYAPVRRGVVPMARPENPLTGAFPATSNTAGSPPARQTLPTWRPENPLTQAFPAAVNQPAVPTTGAEEASPAEYEQPDRKSIYRRVGEALGITGGAPAAAPAAQPYPDEYQAAQAVPDKPEVPAAASPAAPATAPVTPPAAARPAARFPAEGAVIDDERWNPFTRQMRPPAPGTFGSRQEAVRGGTEVPTNTRGVVPTGPSPARPAARPAAGPDQQRGVVRRPSVREVMESNTMAPASTFRYGTQALKGIYPKKHTPPWDDGFYIPTAEEIDAGFVAKPGQNYHNNPWSRQQEREQQRKWNEAGRTPVKDTYRYPENTPGGLPDPKGRRYGQGGGNGPVYHPSGFDPSGAPAYMTRGGGLLREQLGHPAFYDPNFYGGRQQPVYPTRTGQRTIPVEEVKGARGEAPDQPYSRGSTGAPDIVPAYPPGTPGSTPRAGTASGQGGVIPTSGRRGEEDPEARINRRASQLYPAASQAGERQRFIATSLAELEKTEREFGKERLRIDREGVRQSGLLDKQAQIDIEKEKREVARATARIAEIDRKAEHVSNENEKKRLETARKEIVRATMDTALKTNATGARVLTQILRDNPGKSPFEIDKLFQPHMGKLGLSANDALTAAKTMMGINPHTDVYTGGDSMRPPSATSEAAERKINPGDTAYARAKDGTNVRYTVGPDGRWYDDKAYAERFGRK